MLWGLLSVRNCDSVSSNAMCGRAGWPVYLPTTQSCMCYRVCRLLYCSVICLALRLSVACVVLLQVCGAKCLRGVVRVVRESWKILIDLACVPTPTPTDHRMMSGCASCPAVAHTQYILACDHVTLLGLNSFFPTRSLMSQPDSTLGLVTSPTTPISFPPPSIGHPSTCFRLRITTTTRRNPDYG